MDKVRYKNLNKDGCSVVVYHKVLRKDQRHITLRKVYCNEHVDIFLYKVLGKVCKVHHIFCRTLNERRHKYIFCYMVCTFRGMDYHNSDRKLILHHKVVGSFYVYDLERIYRKFLRIDEDTLMMSYMVHDNVLKCHNYMDR